MLIEYRSLESIKPYQKNARKIGQKVIELVAKSIQEFGWRQPIVVDTAGVIVVGHARWLAAKFLKLEVAPVHVAVDLTPEQIRAYRLMDNKSHELAGWDLDLLSEEMRALQGMEIDLGLTGFSAHEIERFLGPVTGLTDPDVVPELPKEIVTRPGDLWRLGESRLICGSSTDKAVVDRLIEGRAPFLMVTDPPYGVELDSEWRDRAQFNRDYPSTPSYMKRRKEGHTNTTVSYDTKADWSDGFELVPSIQVAYVWHSSNHTVEVLNGLMRIGFLHPQQIVWNKGRTVMTRMHYWQQHEPCWYVRKKNAPWFGEAGKCSTVWDSPSPKMIMGGSKEEKFDHPNQKPVELMRRSILNHTLKGELVYEPFGGSGTTVIASEEHERICLACEIEPAYCDVIVMRWQAFTGRSAVLAGHNVTFDQAKEGRRREAEDALMEEAIGKTQGK